MYVHLDHGQVGDDHHAVADALQTLAEAHDLAVLHVLAGMGDDELGAVAELDVLHRQRLVIVHELAGQRLFGLAVHLRLLHRLAGERGVHAAIDDHQTHSAAVHHAGLLEHRQHVRRAAQNRVAGDQNGLEQRVHVLALGRNLLRLVGDDAGDGEDGALLGLHDGLVGGVRALAHHLRQQGHVDLVMAGQRPGEAAQDLAEDDAGIAARALQRAAGHRVRHVRNAGVALGIHLANRGGDGLSHVGAGISVRHGEYIQGVDALAVLRQQRRAGGEHLLEHHAVDLLCHLHFLQISRRRTRRRHAIRRECPPRRR